MRTVGILQWQTVLTCKGGATRGGVETSASNWARANVYRCGEHTQGTPGHVHTLREDETEIQKSKPSGKYVGEI